MAHYVIILEIMPAGVSERVHSLESDHEQLGGHLSVLLLQLVPGLFVHNPRDRVLIGVYGGGALCFGEEGEFSARGTYYDVPS